MDRKGAARGHIDCFLTRMKPPAVLSEAATGKYRGRMPQPRNRTDVLRLEAAATNGNWSPVCLTFRMSAVYGAPAAATVRSTSSGA
jgi:hypothetical protein